MGKNTNISPHIQAQNGLLCHGGDMWQIMTNFNLTCNQTIHVISMLCGRPCGPIKWGLDTLAFTIVGCKTPYIYEGGFYAP